MCLASWFGRVAKLLKKIMIHLKSFGEWEMIKCLGSGSFGVVHQYRHQKSGLEIATKCFKLRPLKCDEVAKLNERWLQEFNWQKTIKNDCFIKALDIEDDEFLDYLNQQQQQQNQYFKLPVIIMEYCNGGDLRTILNCIEHKNGLPEIEVRSVLNCLRNAIDYLHHHCHIEHRDIKPENIVSQIMKNNQRIYKLADFGYVRAIPDMTMAQSVVGTAHYIAPEIIQTGLYNCSVDYWSMGIITFELICGIRPFLPHRKWVTILENITKKPSACIAIIEEFQDDNESDGKFLFENSILPQNNCTLSFVQQIERWLVPVLDLNYKTRGWRNNQLIFYKEMDDILHSRIVRVFSLYNHKFFSYVINSKMSLDEFTQSLREDTFIKELKYILPVLHPKGCLDNIKKAIDFYVPEWCDTRDDSCNPMAMVYVIELRQYDYNAPQATFSSVSMKQCMQVCAERSNLPSWLINDFEIKLNYHLTKEQRHLHAYMEGLHCFAITLEHDIVLFHSYINKLNESLLLLKGRLQQFKETVLCMEKQSCSINKEIFRKLMVKYGGNFFKQCEQDFNNLKNRYAILQRDSTQEAKRDIYEKLIQQDFYKLKSFRSYLQYQDNSTISCSVRQLKERLKECQKFVDFWLKQRRQFHKNSLLKEINHNLKGIFRLYHQIQIDVKNFQQHLQALNVELTASTKSLCYKMKNNLCCNKVITNSSTNSREKYPFMPFNSNNLIKEATEIECSILACLQENTTT